jgi:hypothetical protein
MKPMIDQSAKGRTIPNVTSSSVTTPAREPLSTEQLIELVYPGITHAPEDAETIARELEIIREFSPDALSLAEDLILTGTPTAATLIRRKLDSTVSDITYSRKLYSDRNNWNITLKATGSLDQTALRRLWNCGNVMEESGSTEDTGVPGRLRNVVEQEFRREMPKFDFESTDDRLWRGVAAFTIIDIYFKPNKDLSDKENGARKSTFYRETKKFIDYAGKHKDIDLVIRTAKERDTLVVSELRDIIDRGNTAPSMRDGVL